MQELTFPRHSVTYIVKTHSVLNIDFDPLLISPSSIIVIWHCCGTGPLVTCRTLFSDFVYQINSFQMTRTKVSILHLHKVGERYINTLDSALHA